MNPRLVIKARTAFAFGTGLVLAGLVGAAYFVALFAWQWSHALQTRAWVALPLTLAFIERSAPKAQKAAPALDFIPQLPGAWLTELQPPAQQVATGLMDRVHVGLPPAALGFVLMMLGASLALRQNAVLNAARRLEEDRLRRLRAYRSMDPRTEPYLGPVPEKHAEVAGRDTVPPVSVRRRGIA